MLWQKILVVLIMCVENTEVFSAPLSEMLMVYEYLHLCLSTLNMLMHKYVTITSRLQEFRNTNICEVHLH